ncbi:DUF2478 domain-containing protein [Celeribacter naphthalenivorans]|uniref:DUF2478 domain-containing protein n=1 Tax=Celeribacter naphthalenivorans TaxID=1614694 RepID=UPI001CF9CFD1|nr:DUF2478 domain-containing protein [Celeribacter naphthalenivorans]
MLGYVMAEGRGEVDALLAALAERLLAAGHRVTGAVQINTDLPNDTKCRMELQLLPSGERIQISQSLGALSKGCRLNPEGLEQAVFQTERGLEAGADLVLINKFGKQEVEGRGFRTLIGEALAQGVPVIVGVNAKNIAGFLDFAGEFAEELAPEGEALRDWCLETL